MKKCILIHCTTAAATIKYISRGILALKYCRYIAFWMIMGLSCIWNVRFYSKSCIYTRSDQHNFWFVIFKYINSYHHSVFGIKLKYFMVMKNGSCEHKRRFGEKNMPISFCPGETLAAQNPGTGHPHGTVRSLGANLQSLRLQIAFHYTAQRRLWYTNRGTAQIHCMETHASFFGNPDYPRLFKIGRANG